MALPSSGPISIRDLQTEFGQRMGPPAPGTELNAPITDYYAGGAFVPAGTFGYPIINGVGTKTLIPSSGRIALDNFYGGDSTQFFFVADYMLLTYNFIDGRDLDTRTKITVPNLAGTDYVGWQRGTPTVGRQTTPGGIVLLQWGGDNQGTGLESVNVDVRAIRQNYGNVVITVELRAFWYGTPGSQRVKIDVNLFKGGTMVPSAFSFVNPNPTDSLSLASGEKSGSTISSDRRVAFDGTLVATLTYDTLRGSGTITMNP